VCNKQYAIIFATWSIIDDRRFALVDCIYEYRQPWQRNVIATPLEYLLVCCNPLVLKESCEQARINLEILQDMDSETYMSCLCTTI